MNNFLRITVSITVFVLLCVAFSFQTNGNVSVLSDELMLPIVIEAETGELGSDFEILQQGDITYIRVTTDGAIFSPAIWDSPGSENRVASFEITFPAAGEYNLFLRGKVGSEHWNDDSFFYSTAFGENDFTSSSQWRFANGLVDVGFSAPADFVYGVGETEASEWKWFNISQNADENQVLPYTVEEDNLTVTFQIGGRESNFEIDKIAFGRSDLFFTVANLNNIEPGANDTIVPEPPFAGPPLATGVDKWLGNIYASQQMPDFEIYWNQVTPENAGKWGSVAGGGSSLNPATWNWSGLDAAYNYAKNNGFPFRFHVLVWGNQQPRWIANMSGNPASQLIAIENWFKAVAERYPDIDYLEVVNEPLHDPPNADPSNAGAGNYIEALGGTGVSGWDWVLNAFRMAREIFPPSVKLMINEYNILSNTSNATKYRMLIQRLQQENLIDMIGVQGHAFSTKGNANDVKGRLDYLAQTGLPIQITEFDLDGITDEGQLNDFKRIFPVLWEHPSVMGITLWGWRHGMWRTDQGAYLINPDTGEERPALVWLREYMRNYRVKYLEDVPFIYPNDAYQNVRTYMNPVLPGNHPDLTLFRDGDDFYVSKSSFHFTPYLTIYHSTDLVHWQKLTRVIPPNWSGLLSDEPQAGTWQGAITKFYDSYWIYFSNTAGGGQYFSKADNPAGPWSTPVRMNTTSDTGNSGYDNSVFVDDDGTPYLLIKPGRYVNRIQEISPDGHLTGEVINLDWVNEDDKYSWAEGPVMTKRDGWYYYFVAGNVWGGQWSLRSRTLTGDRESWEELGSVFRDISDPETSFRNPNHITEPIMLDDGTWWCLSHSYERLGSDDWSGLGRQGLLHQIVWDDNGVPRATAPDTRPMVKPNLPRSGIPWKLPRSDYFNNETLAVHWHFLNRVSSTRYSLSDKPGWLTLKPGNSRTHVLQKDAGRYYSLLTHVHVEASDAEHKAGLYLTNGNESVNMKLYSTYDNGKKIKFELGNVVYETENTAGDSVWLKIERNEHIMTAFFSHNGLDWTQLGQSISAVNLDREQENYNWWVGTSQGLFAEKITANFDCYYYRDGNSGIPLAGANNYFGLQKRTIDNHTAFINSTNRGAWLMIGGVELGTPQNPTKEIEITVSSQLGGILEVWLDGLGEEGEMIASFLIQNTGGDNQWKVFTKEIEAAYGQRDVYLNVRASPNAYNMRHIRFVREADPGVSAYQLTMPQPQIYPNPFSSALTIDFNGERGIYTIFDVTGNRVETGLVESMRNNAGQRLTPGMYIIEVKSKTGNFTQKIIKSNQ